MARALHLIDREADFETARSGLAMARSSDEGFDLTVRTIGRGGDYRDVANGAAKLRREAGAFDLIHAWGGRALGIAALGSKLPVIFSPSPETHPKTVDWLRAVMNYRRVEVVCPTTTLRRALVQRGIAFERCHLIRPGVDFSRIKRRKDVDLRTRLRLNERDFVFLAVGESTRAASHVEAVWAASILHVADAKYKIVTWGRGPGAESVVHFANKTMPTAFRCAEQELGGSIEYEALLSIADMILITARQAVATLPIAISMAGALPIVSTVTSTVSELLEDRHTAFMTSGRPRQIARRAMDLIESPDEHWKLSDMARTEAYEFFALTRFVEQMRSVYRQTIESDRVEVEQTAPGAGTRFHGLG